MEAGYHVPLSLWALRALKTGECGCLFIEGGTRELRGIRGERETESGNGGRSMGAGLTTLM